MQLNEGKWVLDLNEGDLSSSFCLQSWEWVSDKSDHISPFPVCLCTGDLYKAPAPERKSLQRNGKQYCLAVFFIIQLPNIFFSEESESFIGSQTLWQVIARCHPDTFQFSWHSHSVITKSTPFHSQNYPVSDKKFMITLLTCIRTL